MFTSRVVYFLALFLSMFAVYVAARPTTVVDIDADVVAYLDNLGLGLVRRGGTCSTGGCNGQSLLDLLLALKVQIDIKIALLNGHNNAATICADIAVIIKAYVKLILALDVNVSGDLGPLVGEIVAVLVAILNGIIGGCSKYSLVTIVLQLVVILDAVLASLVNACCHCCPGLLGSLTAALLGTTWNILGFLLTFLSCGLGL